VAVRHLYFIFLKKKYRYLGWIVPPSHNLPIKIEQKPLRGKCEAIILFTVLTVGNIKKKKA